MRSKSGRSAAASPRPERGALGSRPGRQIPAALSPQPHPRPLELPHAAQPPTLAEQIGKPPQSRDLARQGLTEPPRGGGPGQRSDLDHGDPEDPASGDELDLRGETVSGDQPRVVRLGTLKARAPRPRAHVPGDRTRIDAKPPTCDPGAVAWHVGAGAWSSGFE